MEDRFTFSEVAKRLGVSVGTVWRWHLYGCKGRRLKSFLIGGRRYCTRTQIEKFCGNGAAGKLSLTRSQASEIEDEGGEN